MVNGNPLLRYDGYYILTDLVEIPNLAQRGQKCLAFSGIATFFGAHHLDTPETLQNASGWYGLPPGGATGLL